jgi:hypothetical protein
MTLFTYGEKISLLAHMYMSRLTKTVCAMCHVLLNILAILTLQPTKQPKTKVDGLERHSNAAWLGFPLALGGVSAVYYNKELNGYLHTQTWHAVSNTEYAHIFDLQC